MMRDNFVPRVPCRSLKILIVFRRKSVFFLCHQNDWKVPSKSSKSGKRPWGRVWMREERLSFLYEAKETLDTRLCKFIKMKIFHPFLRKPKGGLVCNKPKGGPTWKRILTYFKIKNKCHRRLEIEE